MCSDCISFSLVVFMCQHKKLNPLLAYAALVESLTQRTRAWEDERGVAFMFDGVCV